MCAEDFKQEAGIDLSGKILRATMTPNSGMQWNHWQLFGAMLGRLTELLRAGCLSAHVESQNEVVIVWRTHTRQGLWRGECVVTLSHLLPLNVEDIAERIARDFQKHASPAAALKGK